jgi:hypothetical protein
LVPIKSLIGSNFKARSLKPDVRLQRRMVAIGGISDNGRF